MPLKNHDPFSSSIERLDAKVNPYVALMRDAAESGSLPILFGPGLKDAAGGWRERIAAYHERTAPSDDAKPAPGAVRRPLIVEIGCHKGVTLLEMAAANPDADFIGIDITYKRVVTTAQRVKALGLRNVYLVMANAVGLDRLFAPAEIDGVVIFFPDPWVKKKSQAKNRLVGGPFCQSLHGLLADGGFVWLKTDQEPYFQAASEHLIAAGLAPLPTQPAGSDAGQGVLAKDVSSTFERRFHEQNLPTYGGKWVRSPAAPTALS